MHNNILQRYINTNLKTEAVRCFSRLLISYVVEALDWKLQRYPKFLKAIISIIGLKILVTDAAAVSRFSRIGEAVISAK